MRKRHLFATLAAAAVLAAAAGCGDDDDIGGGDSGGEPLTVEEFEQRGNEICRAGSQEIAQAAQGLGQNPSQEQVDDFVTNTLVPTIQGQIDDIAALAAPEEIAGDVDAVVADANDVLDQ